MQRPHSSSIACILSLFIVTDLIRGVIVQPVPTTATKGFVAYPAPFSLIFTEKLVVEFLITVAVAWMVGRSTVSVGFPLQNHPDNVIPITLPFAICA